MHVTCHEGCEAGIILQYNEEIYNAAALRDGKLCIYRLGKMLAQKDIGTNECWLRMKNDDQYISCLLYTSDIKRYVDKHYMEKMLVGDIAGYFHMDLNYIDRKSVV